MIQEQKFQNRYGVNRAPVENWVADSIAQYYCFYVKKSKSVTCILRTAHKYEQLLHMLSCIMYNIISFFFFFEVQEQ